MRQESNHRMNNGDKESPRISNSRAMGVIILIVLLFVFQLTAFVVQKVRIARLDNGADEVAEAVMDAIGTESPERSGSGELFPFDPNEISLDSLQLLGFSQRQAQTILNYRGKGGKFRQKKDFAKMYVVDSAMYRCLSPYILLPDKYPVQSSDLATKRGISGAKPAGNENLVPKSGVSVTKSAEGNIFGQKAERSKYMCNLNTADSAALVRLYGIGGYYARKILNYRDKLGGSFVSPRQLLEIDGFTQERYSKIEKSVFVKEEDIKGFSILKADRSSLDRHPYIGPYAARGIVTYLRLKGEYAGTETGLLEELVKERILTPENARKLEEYLLYL